MLIASSIWLVNDWRSTGCLAIAGWDRRTNRFIRNLAIVAIARKRRSARSCSGRLRRTNQKSDETSQALKRIPSAEGPEVRSENERKAFTRAQTTVLSSPLQRELQCHTSCLQNSSPRWWTLANPKSSSRRETR